MVELTFFREGGLILHEPAMKEEEAAAEVDGDADGQEEEEADGPRAVDLRTGRYRRAVDLDRRHRRLLGQRDFGG